MWGVLVKGSAQKGVWCVLMEFLRYVHGNRVHIVCDVGAT